MAAQAVSQAKNQAVETTDLNNLKEVTTSDPIVRDG